MAHLDDKQATREDYFRTYFPLYKHFSWQGVQFQLIRAPHVGDKMPSYGLMICRDKKRVYITTDVSFDLERLRPHYEKADLIIQDCQTDGHSNVHPSFEELQDLPLEIKAKMHLVHYQDNVLNDWTHWQSGAQESGFKGFLWPGETLWI